MFNPKSANIFPQLNMYCELLVITTLSKIPITDLAFTWLKVCFINRPQLALGQVCCDEHKLREFHSPTVPFQCPKLFGPWSVLPKPIVIVTTSLSKPRLPFRAFLTDHTLSNM